VGNRNGWKNQQLLENETEILSDVGKKKHFAYAFLETVCFHLTSAQDETF